MAELLNHLGGERLGELRSDLASLGGALGAASHLDELVIGEGRVDSADHGVGDPMLAEEHDRLEVMTERPQVATLASAE